MAPRFSVLLPTRNRCDLLGFAIASVLWQTERDFELLIVGDGCTDKSAAVVANFNDKRIRWFDLPKAPFFGYGNRNIALRQATGDYIAFIADDDLLFPDHLAMLAATLEKSGAEWVYSRPLWVTTEGLVVPFASNLLQADQLDTFLTSRNHIPATCVLYRRCCVDKYGYWPEEVASAGDWKYWIKIIEGGGRTNFDCCPIPTSLHFNADWKTTPDTQMPQVTAARESASTGAWWPARLRVRIPPGMSEQQVFFELIAKEGHIDLMRQDVRDVIDRMAWMQLDQAPQIHSMLRREITQLRAQLEESARLQADLDQTKRVLLDNEQQLAAAAAALAKQREELEESARLQADLDQTKRALVDNEQQLAAAAAALAKQREELSSKEQQIAAAQATISERTEQIEALQARLDATLASNSWRITAPIRALRNAIRGAFNQAINL